MLTRQGIIAAAAARVIADAKVARFGALSPERAARYAALMVKMESEAPSGTMSETIMQRALRASR